MHDSLPNSADLRWLTRLARALLADASAVEDLVQDTVVATLERPRPAGAPARAWLGTIARRLAYRRHRADSRRLDRERRVAREDALPDSSELVERLDSAEHLWSAVRRLPEPYRQVLLLRFLDDRDAAWIAARDGTPVDTVRRRVRRGLELVREDLDRDARARGSNWALLVAPLLDVPAPASTPKSTDGDIGTALTSMTPMKTLLAGLTLSVGAALFVQSQVQESGSSDAARVASTAPAETSVGTPPEQVAVVDALDSRQEPAERREVTSEPGPLASSLRSAPRPATGIHGVVEDAWGQPLAGALVALAEEQSTPVSNEGATGLFANAGDQRPSPFRHAAERWVETDAAGRFWLERPTPEGDAPRLTFVPADYLWVRANGYLPRSLGKGEALEGELRIALERGRSTRGQLVDETGRPLPDVPLLALAAADTSRNLSSPSSLRQWLEESALGPPEADEFRSSAVTDAAGEFELHGLAGDAVRLVSMDAGWTLMDDVLDDPAAPFRIWTAHRCLGVRVEPVPAPGLGRDWFESTFSATFVLEDGSTRTVVPHSNPLLRGSGFDAVEFRFDHHAVPSLVGNRIDGQKVVSAQIHGNLSLNGLSTNWDARPVDDPNGVGEVVLVRHGYSLLDGFVEPRGGWTEHEDGNEQQRGLLVLNCQNQVGAPYTGWIEGSWTSTQGGRELATREFRRRTDRLGRLELDVPQGQVELTVRTPGAPESMALGPIFCSWNNRTDLTLQVAVGGTVRLQRPTGWAGDWSVRSFCRTGEGAAWQGGWIHTSSSPRTTLADLAPGEWRFELFRRSAPDDTAQPDEVRSGRVEAAGYLVLD